MMEAIPGGSGAQPLAQGDLILALVNVATSAAQIYHVLDADGAEGWIMAANQHMQLPRQGWKLHISATWFTAQEVLRRVLPILIAEQATFKVAPLALLERLNSGTSGLSQIGKFITVYPEYDAQALRLAVELDAATRGLRGPAVPSDRQLSPNSVVSYRYGSFDKRALQDADGMLLAAIEAPDGNLTPDLRLPAYVAPPWISDPFVAAGVAAPEQADEALLVQRYILTGLLAQSARGAVYLAIDLHEQRACVIKQARRDALVSSDGADARTRLRHERDMLVRLAACADLPACYELFSYREDLFLVMEHVPGETLTRHVRRLAAAGRPLPLKKVVAWGHAIAASLAAIHAQQIALCDLKASNVMVQAGRRLRLIDLELATSQHDPSGSATFGTRGYASPQRREGLPPTPADDIYSLGALLYFLVTAAEPSVAPQPHNLLARPLHAFRPDTPLQLEQIIKACLEPDPAARIHSASEVTNALAQLEWSCPPTLRYSAPPNRNELCRHYGDLAQTLGDSLVTLIEAASANRIDRHLGSVFQQYSLGSGLAGVIVACAGLVERFKQERYYMALQTAVRMLLNIEPPHGGKNSSGLYVGRAGVSLALVRAGQALGDTGMIELALAEANSIAAMPHHAPDLFAGSAGRLRLHIQVWHATHEQSQLEAAIAAGEYLLRCAEEHRPQERRWTLPAGYGTNSGKAFAGYAYGAAGIGDALLELFTITGDDRLMAAVHSVARWLARLAKPERSGKWGLGWPVVEGESVSPSYWCHGACGVGRFFLSASQSGCIPEASDLARGAAQNVAHRTQWFGPSQCHGLAGNIDFLLDAARLLGQESWRSEAYQLAALLETFALRHQGLLLWPGDNPDRPDAGFLVGSSGVMACLLRLSPAPGRGEGRGFQV